MPIYTFDTRCNEKDLKEFDDQAHKIFFNTTADLSKLPQGMRNMLEYIETGVARDTATETLEHEVHEARLMEEWRREYMLTITHDSEVFAEGRIEGRTEGIIEERAYNLNVLKKIQAGELTIEDAIHQFSVPQRTVEELS